jgi:hypothetical protein
MKWPFGDLEATLCRSPRGTTSSWSVRILCAVTERVKQLYDGGRIQCEAVERSLGAWRHNQICISPHVLL